MQDEPRSEESLKIREDTNRARLDFVRTEIDAAKVFTRLAETEVAFQDGAGASAALAKADRACEVAGRLIGMAHIRHQDVEALEKDLEEARTKLADLRERFSGARPQQD